ncbi:hypothetical protein NP511_07700 [Natrinema thermotolerans]|uniref:Small CPxCG-related zinc finger protein n=1 Tax=Natrinema thermotolerans TaxID=121872 RepID=A0AAF0T7J3_9EURY|nr:hypothetical protein [Natrinema thermotolerans]WMT09514.1 hypothetical protein NP511_07700 [Natrinema thermotolerans]
MSSDPEAGDDTPFPDCPTCGEPVAFVVATGPSTGTVEPCGCSLPPALLTPDRED